MTLHGTCADCGLAAPLRYKPIVSRDEQSRPTVCARCRDRRHELDPRTVPCRECQTLISEAAAVSIDVSAAEEYYPEYQHYCQACGPTVEGAV